MINTTDALIKDLEAVRQIPVVPTILEVICQVTGMGFAAIARVTSDRWMACSVRDEVQFGLKEGDELEIQTTLCNEIRDHRKPIIIDCVEDDPNYKNHPTPKFYKLQSYISFPILLKDGTFFGTLCAIDAKPAHLNNKKVIDTFSMFVELLCFHLQSQDLLERSYKATLDLQSQNKILASVNNDMDTFVYTASHDLKSPIANIEGLLDILSESITEEKLDREEIDHVIKHMKSSMKRLTNTIRDLTAFIEAENSTADEKAEEINMLEVLEIVKQDLANQIKESQANIEVDNPDNLLIKFPRKKFKSIIYNLVSNAIKYRSPERPPDILVKLEKVEGKMNLSVTDNGLGIPKDQQDKVFAMFKRLHGHVEGTGLGLYIVKKMVTSNNGEIHVDSTLHKGTTFTIKF